MFKPVVVKSALFVCLLFVVLFATSAFADDLFPPPWRGAPGSTFQEWDFLGPGLYDPLSGSYDYLPDGPDPTFNPYGDPVAHVWPGIGQEYWDVWGGRDGVWPLSGVIEIEVPNRQELNPFKEIWIQLTWAQQVSTSNPVPSVIVDPLFSVFGPEVVDDIILGPTGEPTGDGDWHHTTWRFVVEKNPPWEIIRIDGTVMVDQIVIDTICIPEPATMAVLGLGGLVILAYRKRK